MGIGPSAHRIHRSRVDRRASLSGQPAVSQGDPLGGQIDPGLWRWRWPAGDSHRHRSARSRVEPVGVEAASGVVPSHYRPGAGPQMGTSPRCPSGGPGGDARRNLRCRGYALRWEARPNDAPRGKVREGRRHCDRFGAPCLWTAEDGALARDPRYPEREYAALRRTRLARSLNRLGVARGTRVGAFLVERSRSVARGTFPVVADVDPGYTSDGSCWSWNTPRRKIAVDFWLPVLFASWGSVPPGLAG